MTRPYEYQSTLYEAETIVQGFPADDHMSLQQMAGTCGNLETFYNDQFIPNEELSPNWTGNTAHYLVEHIPILAGTMTGTVMVQTNAGLDADPEFESIQTFVMNQNGNLTFTDIKPVISYVFEGSVNRITGEMSLMWSNQVNHKIVISYEFNLEQEASRSKSTETTTTNYIAYLMDELANAKSKLVEAEDKLKNLEVDLYEQYDKKVADVKNYLINKIDEYLATFEVKDVPTLRQKLTVEIFEEATKDG